MHVTKIQAPVKDPHGVKQPGRTHGQIDAVQLNLPA
jgi:hypothetical protein